MAPLFLQFQKSNGQTAVSFFSKVSFTRQLFPFTCSSLAASLVQLPVHFLASCAAVLSNAAPAAGEQFDGSAVWRLGAEQTDRGLVPLITLLAAIAVHQTDFLH